MKKKLTILLTLLICMVAVSGMAMSPDDGENLYLYTKSTKEAAIYSLDELDKITFSDRGVQIWNTNWPTEYVYANVSVLTFAEKETPTSISLPQPLQEEGSTTSVSVYDLQGRKLNSPKRGVNIIRMENGTTKKLIVK